MTQDREAGGLPGRPSVALQPSTEDLMDRFDPYERQVLAELAEHALHPGALQSTLEMIGKPIDLVMARLGQADGGLPARMSRAIDEGVRRAVRRSVVLGGKLMRDRTVLDAFHRAGYELTGHEQISTLGLEARDKVADRFDLGNAAILISEGAILGAAASLAEVVPGAQLIIPTLVASDVAASMTLLSRHLVQLASAYGFSVRRDPANIVHVLGAMVPRQMSYDEGLVPLKIYVMNAAREAGDFVAKVGARGARVGFGSAMRQLGHEAPQLVRLMNLVVERLGLRVSQKVFAMLVPVLGGVVNGGVNLAFQQTGHRTGRDYFRMLILSRTHGDDVVRAALKHEIELLRRSGNAPGR